MKNVVIAGAARTPMGGFQGEFAPMTAARLGGVAIKAALEGAQTDTVDEILMGCVLPAGQGQAPARQAGFEGGVGRRRSCHYTEQDVRVWYEGYDDRL